MTGNDAPRGAGAAVLRVSKLATTFSTSGGPFDAIEDVSFSLVPGEVVALVGESGCGKTVTALSIMRLAGPAARTEGRVALNGTDLLSLSDADMRAVRGREIAMVFQNPLTALNPALRIGDQIAEVVRAHGGTGEGRAVGRRSLLRLESRRSAVWERVVELIGDVGMPAPAECAERWPHELSGGMRQRAVIAAALACGPQVLIADEPTTALDVTVQRQIVGLLDDARQRSNLGILLISHDFALVAEFADRTAVMYAGQIIEWADTARVLQRPLHPYTKALLDCVPTVEEERTLQVIPKGVPSRYDEIEGCRFYERCSIGEGACEQQTALLREVEKGHWVRCHLT